MSYILEALKKSEQERNRGTTPNLGTVQDTGTQPPPPRRRIWLYLLIGALLASTGAVTWYLSPWRTEKPSTSAKSDAPAPSGKDIDRTRTASASGQPSTAVKPSPPPKPAASTSSTTSPPAQPAGVARANPPRDRAQVEVPGKPPGRPPQIAAATPKEPSPPDVEPSRAETSGDTVRPRAVERPRQPRKAGIDAGDPSRSGEKEMLDSMRTGLKRTPSAPKTPPEVSESAGSEPVSGQKTVDYHELPNDVKQETPKMSFSMVVYSEKPEERMININGRTVREGQEVSPGLKLERITSDGGIFTFRGHRFRKGVF